MLSAILLLSVFLSTSLAVQHVNVTATLPGVIRADSDCATFCRFRLCDIGNSGNFIPLPTGFGLTFPPSFVAQPPFICLPDSPIGRVLRVREARVRIRSGRFIRIARLGRNSLRQKFNRNFFDAQDLDLPEFQGLSAVRRSKFRSADQRSVLEGRCVYLPVNAWEARRPDGSVSRVVSSRDRRNCVSFISTATTTQMKITFTWDTAADLDLSLSEPGSNGFEIAFLTNKSPNGGFLFEDTSLGDCDIDGGSRQSVEMIEYSGLSNPPTGTYTINLSQFASCQGLDTNWHLTVTVGDETIFDRTGVIAPLGASMDPSIFETLAFDFPSSEAPASEPELETTVEPANMMGAPTTEPAA